MELETTVSASYICYGLAGFQPFCFFDYQAVYEHHPRPKQLIVENDLPQKLQNLIEERRDGQSSGGQVLVKQMATSLILSTLFCEVSALISICT